MKQSYAALRFFAGIDAVSLLLVGYLLMFMPDTLRFMFQPVIFDEAHRFLLLVIGLMSVVLGLAAALVTVAPLRNVGIVKTLILFHLGAFIFDIVMLVQGSPLQTWAVIMDLVYCIVFAGILVRYYPTVDYSAELSSTAGELASVVQKQLQQKAKEEAKHEKQLTKKFSSWMNSLRQENKQERKKEQSDS